MPSGSNLRVLCVEPGAVWFAIHGPQKQIENLQYHSDSIVNASRRLAAYSVFQGAIFYNQPRE